MEALGLFFCAQFTHMRSATVESETERLDRRPSQFDPKRKFDLIESGRSDDRRRRF
jgi:hypothetical protein